jgi:hypothetical protein
MSTYTAAQLIEAKNAFKETVFPYKSSAVRAALKSAEVVQLARTNAVAAKLVAMIEDLLKFPTVSITAGNGEQYFVNRAANEKGEFVWTMGKQKVSRAVEATEKSATVTA